jgi:NhaP-type Na+/H+ or K+/H+ antiporter
VARPWTVTALSLALVLLMGTSGQAHGVSGFDALFLQGITGRQSAR